MSSTALFRTEAEIERQKVERRGPIQVDTSLGSVTLLVTDDINGLETLWEELQGKAPCTPPQTFAWARAWVRHMVWPEGREPVIAVGHGGDGRVLFLWPFESTSKLGMTALTWLGQAHANYNMGLFDPEAAARFSGEDIARLLEAVAGVASADAAWLTSQPFAWDGVANPFAKLPLQAAPSSGYAVTLGDFDVLFNERFSKKGRREFERKERKLGEIGALEFGWAETRNERLALIETLFAQRSRQYAELGVGNILDAHGRALYREIALLEGDNPSRLRLGYMKVGETVVATFSGSICHNRLSVAFSSLAEGEAQKYSPGLLLLRHQISEACAKGLAIYDIGAGKARNKDQWCDVVQPLFDSFIAFSPQGYLLTLPLASIARAKGAIKSNRHLWPLAQRLRQLLFARKTERKG